VTVVVLVPAVVTLAIYLMGLDRCESSSAAKIPWACTPAGRQLATILGIAILLPIGLVWARFLSRIINYRDPNNDGGKSR
jgi:hypothetical protein